MKYETAQKSSKFRVQNLELITPLTPTLSQRRGSYISIRNWKLEIRNSLRSKAGFTLIELLIVISIIGLLTTLTIAAYRTFDRSQKFNNARNDVINALQVARSRASSQYAPSSQCHQQKPQLEAYIVQIAGNQIITSVDCAVTDPGTADPRELSRIDLSTSVDSITETEVRFNVQGDTLINGNPLAGTITITLGSQSKTIQVDTNGRVDALD